MSHSDDTMGQIVKNMQAANVKLKEKIFKLCITL